MERDHEGCPQSPGREKSQEKLKESKSMKIASWIAITIVVLGLLLWPFLLHANTTSHDHSNGLGVVIDFNNPNIYMFGSVAGGSVIQGGSHGGTNVRFQPAHSFALYTEDILFCGQRGVEFNAAAGGPVVVTYKRQAHEMIDGIGCHELVSIDKVEKKELLP